MFTQAQHSHRFDQTNVDDEKQHKTKCYMQEKERKDCCCFAKPKRQNQILLGNVQKQSQQRTPTLKELQ